MLHLQSILALVRRIHIGKRALCGGAHAKATCRHGVVLTNLTPAPRQSTRRTRIYAARASFQQIFGQHLTMSGPSVVIVHSVYPILDQHLLASSLTHSITFPLLVALSLTPWQVVARYLTYARLWDGAA